MKTYKYIFFIFLISIIIQSCNSSSNTFRIYSSGMYPNLTEGQYVNIEKIKDNKQLDYGDIILCSVRNYTSDDNMTVVSRIIGLPNDTIEVNHDICTINGETNKYVMKEKSYFSDGYWTYDMYEETLPNGKNISILISKNLNELKPIKIILPPEMYYVMGDKRSDSYDSRSYGSISIDQIIGIIK